VLDVYQNKAGKTVVHRKVNSEGRDRIS
jgi:hypothetical protein